MIALWHIGGLDLAIQPSVTAILREPNYIPAHAALQVKLRIV
jgi:hypothetical protein